MIEHHIESNSLSNDLLKTLAAEISNSIDNDIESESICNMDLVLKMRDLQKYFQEYVVYTVEFNHHPARNISSLSLGGRDPKILEWAIEVEPFSTFSYQMMR